MTKTRAIAALLLLAAALVGAPLQDARADLRSYAAVQEDGTLIIQNRLVRLWGVYIPQRGQFCDTQFRPPRCGTRAATALQFKIQGFVTCQEMVAYNDGSIGAVCWAKRSSFNEGEDLGAYLISEGLAVAGPDAPFEYRTLERIAEANGLGIWGFQADQIIRRR